MVRTILVQILILTPLQLLVKTLLLFRIQNVTIVGDTFGFRVHGAG